MNRQRGMILITVLWVIVILTILVLGLGYEARSDLERTGMMRDRSRAYWLARAAVERTKYQYAANKLNGLDQEASAYFRFEFEGGFAETVLLSNLSLMSINSDNQEQWDQLLKFYDLDETERGEIIDAILDWTDPDELTRLNGVESDYYLGLSPPYVARNGSFQSVDELLLVRGITETMFYGTPNKPGLQEFLGTNVNPMGRFDINTASKAILRAFLEITPEEADVLDDARKEQFFRNVNEAAEFINPDAAANLDRFFMQFNGTQFTIKATAFVYDSPARYTVEEEVRYTGSGALFTHLSHKDFSLNHVDERSIDEGAVE